MTFTAISAFVLFGINISHYILSCAAVIMVILRGMTHTQVKNILKSSIDEYQLSAQL